MRLVTYRASVEAAARLGVVLDDVVLDVAVFGKHVGEAFGATMLDFIDQGPAAISTLRDRIEGAGGKFPVGCTIPAGNVRLLAPIPRPRKNLFGIGLNYREHVGESARSLDTSVELPTQPVIFSKPPTAVVGPGDPVVHRADITQQLDWEVELAVVIGRTATRVAFETALSHVFGYTICIDISARDNRRAGQWIYSKGQDTFAPLGPAIVTADDVPDPQMLDLWLSVNGVEKQRSNTRHMLFNVAHLISDISQGITLEPGDIIATGTPAGVGAGRDPQEWLWPGDVIEAGVERIGTLCNPVVAG